MSKKLSFKKLSKTKGQLISKKIVKPRILPKNERMNSFLLVCDVFSFVFWENPWPEKNVSRFTDLYYLHQFQSINRWDRKSEQAK